jgi:hypothetical protein
LSIPEYIEIQNPATAKPVAFLSPKADGIKDVWIDNELNGGCKLEFKMPIDTANAKWQYLTSEYRIIADGKEFVIGNPDSFTQERDGKQRWIKVLAQESWILLSKNYAEAGISNDPQTPTPPALAVIILSGGSDLSGGAFTVGSAGHALYALLDGTDWTVGTVDVTGTHDLEMEKQSILAGVKKVQELWGGLLVWDSVNKTVSLRDETLWQNYTGYQITYAKNLKNITRTDDNTIITKLYPFGADDLDISSVNSGQLYLTNNTYTDAVLVDVWTNQNLTTAQEVMDAGIAYLNKVCKPRHKYTVKFLDLKTLDGYEHETFAIGDMIDLIDSELSIDAQIRIIRYRYNVFQPWLCEIDAGDPLEKIANSIAQAVQASQFINYSVRPNAGFQNLLKALIDTASTEINGASGDYSVIDGVATWQERDESGNLTGNLLRITPLGLIISSDGGQTWTLAINGAGINADMVNTGKLNAGVVTVGAQTTFEQGYDPSQNQSIGMGADENCTGLWHFDGSLNSHKGVAAEFDGEFTNSKFGEGLSVLAGKVLKILTASILDPEESSINFRIYNLASSPNGSVIFDLGDNSGNQAVKVGISAAAGHEGELFIEDEAVQYVVAETSQADFNTGTLTDVQSNPTGDLTLGKEGTDFAVTEDTQAEFEAGTLNDVEATSDDKLKLKRTPGSLIYGSDVTSSAALTSSPVISGQPAYYAFDDSTSSWWAGNDASDPNPWIRLDFGTNPKTIRKLRVFGANNSRQVKDFNLTGSNNPDSGYVELCAGMILRNDSWQDFILTFFNSYRYYRFNVLSWYQYSGPRVYEMEMMEATQALDSYALSGTWEKEYSLAAVGVARGSVLTWNATKPANTSIQVQAAIALDGVNYGSYANCTSGSAIPGITAGMDLSSAKMKIKATLTTTDDSVTPSLDSLVLSVTSAYKTSGSRVHIYDISGVGIAELSSIAWDATLPTGTSLVVKAAISTDGGDTYGAFQNCTSGQPIPVLTANMDISTARLKIQEDLATTDYATTPKLNSLDFSVSKAANVAYGANKSTLIGWDNIAIQWRLDRLSLIINGAESAYIENPGQVTTLAEYAYFGSDKAGANQIGTTIDELRIDRVYQPIEKVNAWHIIDAPFYTSEEFKQWPGYVRVETDGLKVYDSESVLRLLMGSWLRGVLRKFGIKVIDGEIYSSLVSTGTEDAKTFIRLISPNLLQMYSEVGGVSKKQLEMAAPDGGGGGGIDFYVDDVWVGTISGEDSDLYIGVPYGDVVLSSLNVLGTKNCVEITSVGKVGISARESPEVRYIDEDIGVLTDGECRIDLDPIFLEVIESNAVSRWFIHLTPYADVELYVAEVGADYFIVKERNSGITTGAEFTWSLSATRKGYSRVRFAKVGKSRS